MNIGAVGANPLLFMAQRAQNADSAANAFAPTNANSTANSAGSLSILPSRPAAPLSFENILALQSLGEPEEPKLEELSATEKFLQEAQKTPMERMREQILEQLGLSEDALAQMSPEDRRVAEDKIRELIEEKIRQAMNGGDNTPSSNAEMIEQLA